MFLFAKNDRGGVAICFVHEVHVFLQQASVLSVFHLLISIEARLRGLSFLFAEKDGGGVAIYASNVRCVFFCSKHLCSLFFVC
jgi:hypothetical protein